MAAEASRLGFLLTRRMWEMSRRSVDARPFQSHLHSHGQGENEDEGKQ